ncbi:unnamed protein product, partial [Brachionus calyciflorus]
MPKLNSPYSEIDTERPDVKTIESDDEILSSIKQRLISKKFSKNDGNAENLVEIVFENSFENSLVIEDEIHEFVTKKEKKNISRTKSLISNESKIDDSSDDDTIDTKYLRKSRRSNLKKRFENEEQDEEENVEQENDEDKEEEDEVKTDRISFGVWQYFKRFGNEICEHTICQIEERIPCYAHLLDLVIERVFKKYKQLAGKNSEEESEELDESEIEDSEIDENEDDKKKNLPRHSE